MGDDYTEIIDRKKSLSDITFVKEIFNRFNPFKTFIFTEDEIPFEGRFSAIGGA